MKEVWETPELLPVPIEDGILEDSLFQNASTGLEVRAEEKSLQILMGEEDEVKIKTEVPEKLSAPVKKGTEVGKVIYLLNGEVWKSYPVVTTDTVQKKTFRWISGKMCEMFYQFEF